MPSGGVGDPCRRHLRVVGIWAHSLYAWVVLAAVEGLQVRHLDDARQVRQAHLATLDLRPLQRGDDPVVLALHRGRPRMLLQCVDVLL